MTIWLALLVAIVPLFSAGLGAFLHHVLSGSTEARKLAFAARNQAYVDYLRAVAQAAYAFTEEDQGKALLLAADAKARLVVYGEAATIQALAKFEEAGPSLDNHRCREAFLALAASMRERAGDVDMNTLSLVLLGRKRSKDMTEFAALVPRVERASDEPEA